jgi:hypothetical protein
MHNIIRGCIMIIKAKVHDNSSINIMMKISIKNKINNIFIFLPSIIYNLVVVCAIYIFFPYFVCIVGFVHKKGTSQ